MTAYVAFVVPEIDLVLAQTLKEEKDEERKIKLVEIHSHVSNMKEKNEGNI